MNSMNPHLEETKLPSAGPTDPFLGARAQAEISQIRRVQSELAERVAITPWLAQEPVGPQALRELTRNDRDLTIGANN